MKTTTLNRTALSALMGSVLAFGWGAPAIAQAQDLSSQAGPSQRGDSGNDDDAAAKRDARQARKARQDADLASSEAARGQAQVQTRQHDEDQGQARSGRQRDWNREAAIQRQPDVAREERPRQERQPAPMYGVGRPRREREAAPEYGEPQRLGTDPVQERRRQGEPTTVPRQLADVSRPEPGRYGDRSGSERRDGDDRRDGGHRDGDGRDRGREQRIEEQRRQAEAFARQREQRRHDADRWSRYLRAQHRASGYRYQQDYWLRLSRQRYDWQDYDYYNDPYFYSAPSYRYYRGGQSYYINNYAADLLRQAINYGYREGIRAGQADRYDGWRFSYRDAYAYQDASYGYRGMYVSYSEYSYYFREGFRRGYEDGYYDNRRYGRYYNGSDNVLQTVLSLILDLRPYR